VVLLVAALGGFSHTSGVVAADLVIRVVGLRSDRGAVHYAVYDSPAHFPSYDGRIAKGKVVAEGRAAVARIRRLRPGTYAVAVYHDENGNGSFDQGFLGIPLEDYGFSNNAKGFFSAPSFDAASIRVHEPATEITVDLQR
jgi:uncharacterized protein (DUF2141 family)